MARQFKSNHQVMHDLYKLEVTDFKKNVSYTNQPLYERVEHCHFFHSIDNKGNPQNTSNHVGGHFHVLTPSSGKVKDGDAPAYTCSPPMQWMKMKDGTRKMVPFRDDNHIHTVTYLHSDPFQARTVNPEAIKVQHLEEQKKPSQIPGVIG